jgi:hypothetical protein
MKRFSMAIRRSNRRQEKAPPRVAAGLGDGLRDALNPKQRDR